MFLALSAILIYFLVPFLVALATGLVFGMAFTPLLVRWQSKRHWVTPRLKAAVLTLGFFFAFMAPMGATLYFGASSVLLQLKNVKTENVSSALSGNSTEVIEKWMHSSPTVVRMLRKVPISEESVLRIANQVSEFVLEKTAQAGQAFVASVPSMVFGALVALATMFFVLADGFKARRFLEYNPAFTPEATHEIIETFRESSYSVVVSAVVARVAQAVVMVIPCFLTGKGMPVLVGLITFFCSFLPLFGSFLVAAALIVSQLIAGNFGAAVVFLIFGLIAGGVDNLLMSWLVGDQVKVPAFVVFVTAFGAMEMIGLSGIFVGPVLAATFLKVIEVLSHPRAALVKPDLGRAV